MNLHIKVVEAVDVPKMDVFSKSDPYCVISLTGFSGRKRTKTIQNNDHPIWNEEFHFPIQSKKNAPINDFGSIKLCVTLFDEDTFSKDDEISSIEISLNDYIIGRIYDEWYSLFPFKKAKEGGRIHMIVNILPKDIKPFTQMAINQTNSSMNYNYMPSQLPQLNQNQMMMNQNQMCMQRQQQAMNQYPQMGVQYQQPMNPYLQQQQQLQMQQMQLHQMQQMQQMQRLQQMQRMQTFQSNPYLAQQPQVYSPMPNYNYSNMNGNMMFGAVPPPTQNVGYPTVTPSQLPRISNTHNTF